MKIDPRNADNFCRAPASDCAGVLLYGENQGLVEERARALAEAILGPDSDDQPVEITTARLRETPSLIADEMQARALLGGRKLLRVRDVNAKMLDGIAQSLTEAVPDDGFLVITVGSLGPREKLRKLFEGHPRGAAVPCYVDDSRSMERFITDYLRRAGVGIEPGARGYLAGQLGNDRQVARRELEKLALYVMDNQSDVTLEDAVAVIDEGESLQLNDAAFAAFGGDFDRLEATLGRLLQAKTQPITVLNAVTRHGHRLHLTRAGMAGGRSAEQAAKALRPPLFFKDKSAFLRQAQRWPAAGLARALEILRQAEADCKTTGFPAEAICRRALTQIAAAGRRQRR